MILRKWELIKIHSEPYPQLQSLASDIDKIIKRFYGKDKHTHLWIKDYFQCKEILDLQTDPVQRLRILEMIARDPDYCIACGTSFRDECGKCYLQRFDANCGDPTSLFAQFIREIEKIIREFAKDENSDSGGNKCQDNVKLGKE